MASDGGRGGAEGGTRGSGGGAGGGAGGSGGGAEAARLEALRAEAVRFSGVNICIYTDESKGAEFRHLFLNMPGIMSMAQAQDSCREKTSDDICVYWPFMYFGGMLMCLRVEGETSFAQWRGFMMGFGIVPTSDVPAHLAGHGVTEVYEHHIFGLKGGYVSNFGGLPPGMSESEKGKALNEGYANICMLAKIPDHILEQILSNMRPDKVYR